LRAPSPRINDVVRE